MTAEAPIAGAPVRGSIVARALLPAGLVVAVLAPGWRLPFLFDDYAKTRPLGGLVDLLAADVGLFAPLPRLVWAVLVAMLGLDPLPHRVAFTACAVLVALVASSVLAAAGARPWIAGLGGALVALHPAADVGWAWPSCWGHALCLLGALTAARGLLASAKDRADPLLPLGVAVALASKETAVAVVPAVLLVTAALAGRPLPSWRAWRGVAAVALGWAVLRVGVQFADLGYGRLGPLGAPVLHGRIPEALAAVGVRLLDPAALLPLLPLLALRDAAGRRLVAVGLAAALAAALPAALLPGYLDGLATALHERLLTGPAAVTALLVAGCAARLGRGRPRLAMGLLAAVVAAAVVDDLGSPSRLAADAEETVAEIARIEAEAAAGATAFTLDGRLGGEGMARWLRARAAARGADVSGWTFTVVRPDGSVATWPRTARDD